MVDSPCIACSGSIAWVEVNIGDKCDIDIGGNGGVIWYCDGGEVYGNEYSETTVACTTLHSSEKYNMGCDKYNKKFCTVPTAAQNSMYDCIVWRYNDDADCGSPKTYMKTNFVATNICSERTKFRVNNTHFIVDEYAADACSGGIKSETAAPFDACSNTLTWDPDGVIDPDDWSELECFDPPLSYAEALARTGPGEDPTTTAVPSCGYSATGLDWTGLAAVSTIASLTCL